MLNIEDYVYELPPEAIAQVPAKRRDHSRLLVVDRSKGDFFDKHFFDLPKLLSPKDLLVVNNTRVVPARLFGKKETGGRVEVVVLEHQNSGHENPSNRLCLLKASKRPKIGSVIFFKRGVSGEISETLNNGLARITFKGEISIDSLLEAIGQVPLPPYIKRNKNGGNLGLDRERYQTIFSKERGAIAAPTAGLHFSDDLIKQLTESGIRVTFLTLHVGYGTFRPVRTRDIRKHSLDAEYYRIGKRTADLINKTRANGGRVIAVGTTVVRALETVAATEGQIKPGDGMTDLLIAPGFSFRVVDALITNFHLPKSSLLFLVSAFVGLDFVKTAYKRAMQRGYRFYSYGDAMLIL